jgi:hypothetical protein
MDFTVTGSNISFLFFCCLCTTPCRQLADADDSGGIDLNEFRQLFALLSVISGESVNDGTIIGREDCYTL